MTESANFNAYLTGDSFSAAYRYQFPPTDPLQSRFDFIDDELKGKRVIHVGCVDHVPLLKQKMDDNLWVHGRITTAAQQCIGYDINREGIDLLRSEYKVQNVEEFDVCSDVPESARGTHWDVMFIGEVVEHIDNPVAFLSSIRQQWSGHVDKLVVTVPNALRYENVKAARSGYELINSDHRFWFTPFTISKVVSSAGFSDPQVRFVCGFPRQSTVNPRAWLANRRVSRTPAFRDTLLLEADFA